MTNPQNYVAVPVAWTASVPVDIKVELGVQSVRAQEPANLTRAEAWFINMMRRARATGKCELLSPDGIGRHGVSAHANADEDKRNIVARNA